MVSTRFTNHALILVVISTVVVPIRFALKERHAEERRRIETKGQIQRARELAARWNALRYAKAEAGKLSDAFLAKTNWASLKLSDLQSTKLERRLRELFDYLQNPRVEAYTGSRPKVSDLSSISLRWSEADRNWVPSRMFTDILLNMNLLF